VTIGVEQALALIRVQLCAVAQRLEGEQGIKNELDRHSPRWKTNRYAHT